MRGSGASALWPDARGPSQSLCGPVALAALPPHRPRHGLGVICGGGALIKVTFAFITSNLLVRTLCTDLYRGIQVQTSARLPGLASWLHRLPAV